MSRRKANLAQVALQSALTAARPVHSGGTGGDGTVPRKRQSAFERPLAVRLVEGVYVVLLGFLFPSLVFTILTPLPVPADVPRGDASRPVADLTVFSRFDPFVGNVPQVAPIAYEAAEETRLNLKLKGTYVIGDEPSAIIQIEDGSQKLYLVGDDLRSGVTVRDILADQVILSRNGVTETLSLENRDVVRSTSPAEAGASIAGENGASGAVPAAARGAPTDDLLSRYVRMEPHPSGEGLTLYAGSNPALFEAAGLINGDQLIAINGQPVPQRSAQAVGSIATLMARGPVTVTVNRKGVVLNLSLDPSGL